MKRIFKSLVAALLAACVCVSMVMPVPMSADADTSTVSPFDGDLDGDGDVDLSDVVIIGKYLNGQAEITDLQAADVNCNYLIDIVDQKIMLGYITNVVDSLPVVTDLRLHAGDEANVLTISDMDSYRNYVVYNYADMTTSTYTLTANVEQYSMERAGLLDDRKPAGETSVVMIGTSTGFGTGFIVDKNIIATAAHCVYDRDTSLFDPSVVVKVKNEDSTQTPETLTAKEVHILSNYISLSDTTESYKYDYALIYLGDNVDLSDYGMFALGVPSDEFMICNANVTVSGFPGDIVNPNYSRYNATGKIMSMNAYEQELLQNTGKMYTLRNHQIRYTTYAGSGQSGGPVYVVDNFNGTEYYTAIGIHTSSGDSVRFGTRMTTDLLHFYYNNDYIGSTLS